MKQRDITIDILKGIGIILMVLGHAGCPAPIKDYIYTFHMPLFFLASGYFFSEKNLENKKAFFIKKVKGIYLPFLICSFIFLALHNVFFQLGIINGTYGDANGPSELYSLKESLFRALMITVRMDRYESFLLGAYWFMRSLFFGTLLICFGSWAFNRIFKSVEKAVIVTSVVCLLGAGILRFTHTGIPFIARSGYCELMGAFFIGIGFLLRKKSIDEIKSILPFLVSLAASAILFMLHPASLEMNDVFMDWVVIPFSGITGFYIIFWLSQRWKKIYGGKLMAFIGEKSIWILTLHFLCFKISGILKISFYDLPSEMIGCHPVIPPQDNFFFIIHTVTAVAIPVLVAFLISKIGNRIQKS